MTRETKSKSTLGELAERARDIRIWLLRVGMTQKQVADEFGLNPSSVGKFVTGERPDHVDVMAAFQRLGWFGDVRDSEGRLLYYKPTDAPAGDHQPSSVASANSSTIGVSTQPQEAAS